MLYSLSHKGQPETYVYFSVRTNQPQVSVDKVDSVFFCVSFCHRTRFAVDG